jgi:hypothetical protein
LPAGGLRFLSFAVQCRKFPFGLPKFAGQCRRIRAGLPPLIPQTTDSPV